MAAKALFVGRQAAPGWWVSLCGWVCCGEGQLAEGIPPHSVYVNVDVQLFWKLLLAVWKATDNSVFCKLTPHPHSSIQEEYCNHIDSNRFILNNIYNNFNNIYNNNIIII